MRNLDVAFDGNVPQVETVFIRARGHAICAAQAFIGKDLEGKGVKFSRPIYAEDREYPTQLIVIDEEGESGLYIWKGWPPQSINRRD